MCKKLEYCWRYVDMRIDNIWSNISKHVLWPGGCRPGYISFSCQGCQLWSLHECTHRRGRPQAMWHITYNSVVSLIFQRRWQGLSIYLFRRPNKHYIRKLAALSETRNSTSDIVKIAPVEFCMSAEIWPSKSNKQRH